MKKSEKIPWLDRKHYLTDDWGESHDITNREWLRHHIMPDVIAALFFIGFIVIMIMAGVYSVDHEIKYDAAVIVGDKTSTVVHVDHYKRDNDRYIIYDKDGSIYNVNRDLVVFYNYDD